MRRWPDDKISLMMTIAGLAGAFAQTPAGVLTGASRCERALAHGAIAASGALSRHFGTPETLKPGESEEVRRPAPVPAQ